MESAPFLAWMLVACGETGRPNILLITLDTTRADMIGAYGNREVQTPNLDRLAADGVRFDRAYTVTPLTIPAHSSLMTGLLPPRHGVRDNGDYFLGQGAHTLAEILHENGYATMAAVGAEVTSHHWGFAQGFDAFYDDLGETDVKANRWRVERPANAVVADARGWFDARPRDAAAPWFAWVHLFDAHHPYEPPEPYATLYPDRPYLGEISWVDSQVGSLLEHLRERGELDDTWIVVMADHGEGLGSHGEAMHGVLLYDATTHVPLIIRPPGGRRGTAVQAPVSLVDVMPTLLAAAGAPIPAGLDGVDQGAVIAGTAPADVARTVYAESLYALHHYGWAAQKALITDDHKLIDSTTPEVYARGDLLEKSDLVATDTALLTRMKGQLAGLEAGMAPADGSAQRVSQSAEMTAQLEALGYVTGDVETAADVTGLPDPVKRLPALEGLEKARQALQGGDLPAARLAVEALIEAEPGLAESRMLLATILARQGELPAAYAVAEELNARQPASQSRAFMGTLKVQMGDPAAGVRLLSEALEIDPYLEGAWASYLRTLLLQGDLPRLATETTRARRLLPGSAVIRGMDGIVHAMRGDFEAAEPLLDEAMRRDPTQPFLNHALGITLRGGGKGIQAESLLLEEVRLFPPAIASRRVLVEIYADQKRYDEQLAQLTEIARVEPPSPLTLHSTAQALFNLGRYAEAAPLVEDCISIAPAYPGCALLHANVLKKLGRDAEAQAAFDRAVKLREGGP